VETELNNKSPCSRAATQTEVVESVLKVKVCVCVFVSERERFSLERKVNSLSL